MFSQKLPGEEIVMFLANSLFSASIYFLKTNFATCKTRPCLLPFNEFSSGLSAEYLPTGIDFESVKCRPWLIKYKNMTKQSLILDYP